jgi:hypothetical protein
MPARRYAGEVVRNGKGNGWAMGSGNRETELSSIRDLWGAGDRLRNVSRCRSAGSPVAIKFSADPVKDHRIDGEIKRVALLGVR